MSNCKSNSSVSHFIIDVSNEQAVLDTLMEIMEQDNDLTENEDYFQEDTLELGYESEADRIVKEYIKKHGFPKTLLEYKEAFTLISYSISNQEYFGECSIDFIKVNDTTFSVAFMIGGQNS